MCACCAGVKMMTPTQRAAPRDQHRVRCLGRRLDAHVVDIPKRPQRRRRRRKLPVLDTVVTRPCRVHLCVPRGGRAIGRVGAEVRRRRRLHRHLAIVTSPHRFDAAVVSAPQDAGPASCDSAEGSSAPALRLVGRLSLVANRRTVVTAVICVLLSAVNLCASRSVFEMSYQVYI